FTAYQGAGRNNLARVNLNGVLYPGFDVGFGVDGNAVYISALARQPDGKILVIGDFESFNGTERIDVLRLMPSASYVDCLGTLSGPALPGSPCDDLDEGTVNDTWTADCECLGIPLVPDCVGDLGGTALPGTPCDDEDNTTTDDTWTNDCECEGTPPVVDCMGVLGGPNTPGAPCDDGILFTTNDTWTFACECEGFDCAGQQGGLGLPGTPCDDGVSWTYQDTWSADCECMGVGMVGIADQIEGKTHFQLWPNPTQPGEGFWIQTSYVGSVQLEVIDPLGRTQRTITYYAVSNKPIHLSTQGLQAGSYLLHIQNGVEREVHRIVIR
ncbi:MAG: T9SS type A sorting domain-containing protein, partial [Flavobacteriales bacterium]|nr:T9SS type A sorting domain-containing protein [Flavobacteriales bacterium]